MKAGLVLATALLLAAPAAANPFATSVASPASSPGLDGGWAKEIAFRYEAAVDGAYPEGHWFSLTPEDGSVVPYGFDGYAIPVAWAFPGDPREQTGRDVAWTSAGQTVRFTEPDGAWTEVFVRDDATYVLDTSAGQHAEYGTPTSPLNFTEADFTQCTESVDGACVRFAGDEAFSSPNFYASSPGRYTIALTLTDADGASRTHETAFEVLGRAASPPRELLAVPSADGGPYLAWQVPEDEGGHEVLYYAVHRDDGRGARVVAYVAGTSFAEGDLPDGTYTYTVTAFNAAGESLPSNVAVAHVLDPEADASVTVDLLGEERTVEASV